MDGSLWTAVIAAGSAIAGGAINQLGASWGKRGDRAEVRRQLTNDLYRASCDACQRSAVALRKELVAVPMDPAAVTLAMNQFEADLPRIHDAATLMALRDWAAAGIERANGLIGSAAEGAKWAVAMDALGQLWRDTVG